MASDRARQAPPSAARPRRDFFPAAAEGFPVVAQRKGARLRRGYRGAAPADEGALRDVLFRVSALGTAAPEIQELDLNPMIVTPSGACVADVRVRIDHQRPPLGNRRIAY